MRHSKHASPRDNPLLPEAVYAATVVAVTDGTYGRDEDHYIQIQFWLATVGDDVITNLYFPSGAMLKAKQRLWHFAKCVGLEAADAVHEPDLFRGCRLRLDVRTMSSGGNKYSDVYAFLPAEPNRDGDDHVDMPPLVSAADGDLKELLLAWPDDVPLPAK